MDAAKVLDFFNFFEETPVKSESSDESGTTNEDKGRNVWKSGSAATSPMSNNSAYSPTPELHTPPPKTVPRLGPEARPSAICPVEGVKKRMSVRKRRSSVFFKLGEMGKVRNSAAVVNDREKKKQAGIHKIGDSMSSSSNRCLGSSASITPFSASFSSTRPPKKDPETDVPPEDQTAAVMATTAAAAAAVPAVTAREADSSRLDFGAFRESVQRKGRRSKACGEPPLGRSLFPKDVRPSSRALSAGHRRESCRDGGFSRPPDHGLSAEKLLLDALEVSRIRADGGLRASFQGVCWIASNWSLGNKKGVMSGRRYLVLCDKIVWAELCEAGGRDSVTSKTAGEEDERKQAGFLPVISMAGSIVQHCEVATSNNGWVIEVVNPETNTTLWLDPANPTGLLRWGSVLCQSLLEGKRGEEDE